MSVQVNKEAARAYFTLVLNQGDLDSADRIFAPDLVFHYPLGSLSGANEVKAYIQTVRVAFPDIAFEVASVIGEERHVAVRWSLTGTQTGNFKGKSPSGKRVNVPGITWFHVDDGQIREMWVSFDPSLLIG